MNDSSRTVTVSRTLRARTETLEARTAFGQQRAYVAHGRDNCRRLPVTDHDDWFERALATEGDDDDVADGDTGDADTTAETGDREETTGEHDRGMNRTTPRSTSSSSTRATEGPETSDRGHGGKRSEDDKRRETDSDESDSNDSDTLFDEDFGSALENAPAATGGGQSGSPAGFSDIDFELGGDDPDFEEDPDTDLPRIDLGVDGLDRMIQGGVPERSLMVAIGSAGTGKTTFGLQFRVRPPTGRTGGVHRLRGESGACDQQRDGKGFAFDEHVADGRLAIVDLNPVELAHSLGSIGSELPTLIEEFGASRLVLDSVSLLEMMYDDQAKRRNEIFSFAKSLKDAGVTSLLTSEAADDNPYASRHGIVEYLTDGVFVLQYVRPNDFRETRLAIEIQKIRDANHSREKSPTRSPVRDLRLSAGKPVLNDTRRERSVTFDCQPFAPHTFRAVCHTKPWPNGRRPTRRSRARRSQRTSNTSLRRSAGTRERSASESETRRSTSSPGRRRPRST
ncbi:KaiC domain-containing protein [Natrialba swarupiae]|nr:KaiC domain-containing protein [Natrialba swarupiae]